MVLRISVLAGLAVTSVAASVASAQPTPTPSLAGVWSIGETANCTSGNAWVFHADGYYAEVALPDKGPKAVGMWKDEGATIAYTHSHMPFADMITGAPARRFTVEQRTTDRLVLKTFRGTRLVMNRCPVDAVKAPAGQAEH